MFSSSKELAEALKVLREAGVTSFKCNEFSVEFGNAAPSFSRLTAALNPQPDGSQRTPVSPESIAASVKTDDTFFDVSGKDERPEEPKTWHQRMWNKPPRFPRKGSLEEPKPPTE